MTDLAVRGLRVALSQPATRRWQTAWGIGVVGYALVAIAFAMQVAIRAYLTLPIDAARALIAEKTIYTGTVLSVDYAGLGWVRRGLGGTLAAALGSDWITRVLYFHTVSLVALLIPLLMLTRRLWRATPIRSTIYMAAFLLMSPQTFLSWRSDIGRTDILCLTFIAWSFIYAVDGRWKIAAAILGASLLLHETGIIFGGPLLCVVAWQRLRAKQANLASFYAPALIFCLVCALVSAGPIVFGPTSHQIFHYMRTHSPAAATPGLQDLRDCAIYMLAVGSRGIRTAICYNEVLALYPLMVAMGIVVALISACALGLIPARPIAVIAIILPLGMMYAIANDSARWISFAVVGLWLVSAWSQIEGFRLSSARIAAGCGILTVLLLLGPGKTNEVNHFATNLAAQLGYPPFPSAGQWMTRCDKDWHAIVNSEGRSLSL